MPELVGNKRVLVIFGVSTTKAANDRRMCPEELSRFGLKRQLVRFVVVCQYQIILKKNTMEINKTGESSRNYWVFLQEVGGDEQVGRG
jgi:hypothetical protein